MPETAKTNDPDLTAAYDPADDAMCSRAKERFAADRNRRLPRRKSKTDTMPNFIIIGGLKCGTTSIHHYLGCHPDIHMSKPKELNFFAAEQNWDLGFDWYKGRFDNRFKINGESSPHYTNRPRFNGVAERIHEYCPDARLIYMVRDPIKRILSHWVHATGAGYETREFVETLNKPDTSYIHRSMYWMQLQPYLEHFDPSQIELITQEELGGDRDSAMKKAFSFLGVDENFTSEQWDRQWEKSSAKEDSKYQFMEKLIKLPGFRSFDRNFDRLPESMRWMVEKAVHNPDKPPAPKPVIPDDLMATLKSRFREDVASLEAHAGHKFDGWHDYTAS
ncbi:MAG: sulfotransferase [Solirubrobacterales bacterium]|nr:sulfotransferase [Solirubrobacterales bacterium]